MNLHIRVSTLVLALSLCLSQLAWAAPQKLIALTFDDGPNNEITPQILNTLAKKNSKATFFVVGKWLVDKQPLLLQELAQGHQLASHTYHHVPLVRLGPAQIQAEETSMETYLKNLTGQTDYMLRPPLGFYDKTVLENLKTPIIKWNIDPAQGEPVPAAQMAEIIVSEARDGSIILMHDTTLENAGAIIPAIDALHNMGYELVTLDELFRLKGVTPRAGVVYRSVVNSDPYGYDEDAMDQHWAVDYIRYMYNKCYMTGDSNGWHPNALLTRAAAADTLWRMAGKPCVALSGNIFPDVAGDLWYSAPIAWATAQGLLSAGPDGGFWPEGYIPREQFYALVARLAKDKGLTPKEGAEPVTYQDDWRMDAGVAASVSYLRTLGFSSDYDVELFRPKAEITRAEAAELLTWLAKGGIK